jgi:hypothetical protein
LQAHSVQHIVAVAADQNVEVEAEATFKKVVSGLSVNLVRVVAAIDLIAVVPGRNIVDTRAGEDLVLAIDAKYYIVAAAGVDDIVSTPSDQ